MTTSILSSHGGRLNGYDLAVLRDYALEAPWEWRKALDELIDVAAAAERTELAEIKKLKDELAEAEERADELEEQLAESRKGRLRLLKAGRKLVKQLQKSKEEKVISALIAFQGALG